MRLTKLVTTRAFNLTINGNMVRFKGLKWPWMFVKEWDASRDLYVIWGLHYIYRIIYRITYSRGKLRHAKN